MVEIAAPLNITLGCFRWRLCMEMDYNKLILRTSGWFLYAFL